MSNEKSAALIEAVKANDPAEVAHLLAAGAPVNSQDEELGWTPLHFAATAIGDDDLTVARLLLEAGADATITGEDDDPVTDYCGPELEALIEAVQARSASPEELAGRRLLKAVAPPDIETIQTLIAEGVDVDAGDPKGRTALSLLANQVRYVDGKAVAPPIAIAAMEILLDAGADPNRGDSAGYTPLIHACRIGNLGLERAKLLVARGANVNLRASFLGHSALHFAAETGRVGLVRLLLDAGADVNAVDDIGQTAMAKAKGAGVKRLLTERME